MTHVRVWCCAVLLTVSSLSAGCAPKHVTVAATFPKASAAAPWILDGEVWSGPPSEAIAALGSDADDWRPLDPSRVWLAVYRHQSDAQRTLTLRAFAFATPNGARRAYERFKSPSAAEFNAGDEGCWTGIGVLFVWGRLVFDIFGSETSQHSEVQAAIMAGAIEKRMPEGLPDDPR